MTVMPANSTGWFWHCLARETGRVGHLYSPGAQRGPWPWLPYALDNGAFSHWDMATNSFDYERWERTGLPAWLSLIAWANANSQKPLWAIVPDVPGNGAATIERYAAYCHRFAGELEGVALAVAVQDGMSPSDIEALHPAPAVICVGGTTEWKWATVEEWARSFPRVHLLRCNSPKKLDCLQEMGVMSCDGTGWNRGDKNQTAGLESFLRRDPMPDCRALWPYVCRAGAVKGTGQRTIFDAPTAAAGEQGTCSEAREA